MRTENSHTDKESEQSPFITKNEWVYNRLKDDIAQGVLSPGQRIVVSKIAQAYKVSPMPVRDALNRLHQDGFIEIAPHSGATVISVNIEQLHEIMEIRQELEALATAMAVPLLTNESLNFLNELLKQMLICAENKDSSGYEQLNWDFHEHLYVNCGNDTLYNLVMTLWRRSCITRTVFMRIPDKIELSVTEHQHIIAAINAKDAKIARDLMFNHIKYTTERLSDMLKT